MRTVPERTKLAFDGYIFEFTVSVCLQVATGFQFLTQGKEECVA